MKGLVVWREFELRWGRPWQRLHLGRSGMVRRSRGLRAPVGPHRCPAAFASMARLPPRLGFSFPVPTSSMPHAGPDGLLRPAANNTYTTIYKTNYNKSNCPSLFRVCTDSNSKVFETLSPMAVFFAISRILGDQGTFFAGLGLLFCGQRLLLVQLKKPKKNHLRNNILVR